MNIPAGIRYYDLRHVTGHATVIDIDNGIVESAGTTFFNRALIRVLGRKGWGIVQADNFDPDKKRKFEEILTSATRLAALTEQEVCLADARHAVRRTPTLKEDPRDIPLCEKTEILGGIERRAAMEGIVNRRASYIERMEHVAFSDSSGLEASYEMCRSGFSVLAVASQNGNIQMASEREHSIRGFALRHRNSRGRKAAERALALLKAGHAKGGRMRAVLDPELAGVFAHEAVGHASEGDLIQEGNSVLSGRFGEQIGSREVTIVDDPALPAFGFEPFDAEGVVTRRTVLIQKGVVTSFLHNRETLAAVGNGVAGHARAMPGEPPLVRMSNTYIAPGDAKRDEIIEECRNGIYLVGSRGGQVDPGRGIFQFMAEYGYLMRKGECTKMVRDLSLSGEIQSTLHDILLCGNDRVLHPGYCGKNGQSVPVSDGAPHILLDNAVVGGSDVD